MSGHPLRRCVGGSIAKLTFAGWAAVLAGGAWLACTPPGGGTNPPDDPDAPLVLSASKVSAGQFFSLEHPSIQAGDLVKVRFRQLDGVEMMFESQEAEAGMVRLPAPSVVDEALGLRGGILRVSIEGVDEEPSLEVESLPDLGDLPPGTILDLLLNSAIEDLFDLETTLRDAPDEFGDVSETEAAVFAITQERRRLEGMHIGLVLDGTLDVEVSDGDTVTLGESELRLLDRYLAAQIMGLYEEVLLAEPLAARTVSADCISQIRSGAISGQQAIEDCFNGMVDGVTRAAIKGAKVAQAPANLIAISFTIAGVVFKAPLIILTGVLIAGGNAVWSYATASAAKENTDAFLLRRSEDYNSSKEGLSQLTRNATNFLGNVPGPTGVAFSAVTVATSVKDLNAAVQAARCEEGLPSQRVIQSAEDLAFCSIVTADGDGDQPDDGPPVGTCGECTSEFPLCNEQLGLCVACLDDQDCSDGTVCATNLGGCVECVEDADCVASGRGTNCRIFVCDDDGPECSTDFDCVAAGLGNACTSDGTTDVCVTVPGNCFSDGDCSGGLFCVLASGEDAGTCAECRNDEDCDDGLTCDGFFRCSCVPGFCPVP